MEPFRILKNHYSGFVDRTGLSESVAQHFQMAAEKQTMGVYRKDCRELQRNPERFSIKH